MSKRIIIIGAGGYGKVITDIAIKNGYKDICFWDDKMQIYRFLGKQVMQRDLKMATQILYWSSEIMRRKKRLQGYVE